MSLPEFHCSSPVTQPGALRMLFAAALLLPFLITPRAEAQVRSLTVGVDTTCPYGLVA